MTVLLAARALLRPLGARTLVIEHSQRETDPGQCFAVLAVPVLARGAPHECADDRL